jgi:hypothetical protein
MRRADAFLGYLIWMRCGASDLNLDIKKLNVWPIRGVALFDRLFKVPRAWNAD